MKKIITLILATAFIYSCSTSSDGNGNANLNQSESMLVGRWEYYVSPHPSFPNVASSYYKSYFVLNQDKSGTVGFEDIIPNQPTSDSDQITWSATSSVITGTYTDNTTISKNYIVIDQTHIKIPDDDGIQRIYTKI